MGKRNEKGGALVYVLMIVMLIGIATPVIFQMMSSRQSMNQKSELETVTRDLAISGVESFIKYLTSYTENNKRDHFNAYKGWGTKTVSLPDGKTVTISQIVVNPTTNSPIAIPVSSDQAYDVIITATTGDTNANGIRDAGELRFQAKSIRYSITASNASGAVIDPTNPTPVPTTLTGDHVFIQDKNNASTGSSGVTVTETPPIQEAITNYLGGISSTVSGKISSYLSSITACGTPCTNLNADAYAIQSAVNSSTAPVVYYKAKTIDMWGTQNVTIGSPSKPVVLYLENNVNLSNDSKLTIYGTLVVKGSITLSNKTKLTINEVNNSYGDLLSANVNSTVRLSNESSIVAAGMAYFGELEVSNFENKLIADQIVIVNNLRMSNFTTLTTNGSNVIIGGNLVMSNDTNIDSQSDILVAKDVSMTNKSELSSGGFVAVGGNLSMTNTSDINTGTGGGTTIITVSPGSSSTGDTTGPVDWNITRK